MKKIIVPVDFSFHSCQAASFALGLARDLDMEVHLLHVSKLPVPPLTSPVYGADAPMVGLEPLIKEIRHEAKASMENLMQDLEKDARDANFHGPLLQTVLEGDAVQEIRTWVREHEPACMVLGVTPRSSLYRMFIGSVAGQLLQQSEWPVIAVPTGAVYTGLDKLVFASDFDPEDLSMVEQIRKLLDHQVRDWYVVHMINDLEEQYFFDREEELQQKLLSRWQDAMPGSNLHTDILTEGSLLEAVESYAKQHEAGMVAFVMHRRNALGRLLDPSVSSEALFHLHLPMLFMHTQSETSAIW